MDNSIEYVCAAHTYTFHPSTQRVTILDRATGERTHDNVEIEGLSLDDLEEVFEDHPEFWVQAISKDLRKRFLKRMMQAILYRLELEDLAFARRSRREMYGEEEGGGGVGIAGAGSGSGAGEDEYEEKEEHEEKEEVDEEGGRLCELYELFSSIYDTLPIIREEINTSRGLRGLRQQIFSVDVGDPPYGYFDEEEVTYWCQLKDGRNLVLCSEGRDMFLKTLIFDRRSEVQVLQHMPLDTAFDKLLIVRELLDANSDVDVFRKFLRHMKIDDYLEFMVAIVGIGRPGAEETMDLLREYFSPGDTRPHDKWIYYVDFTKYYRDSDSSVSEHQTAQDSDSDSSDLE
jgi:hypothetical protein